MIKRIESQAFLFYFTNRTVSTIAGFELNGSTIVDSIASRFGLCLQRLLLLLIHASMSLISKRRVYLCICHHSIFLNFEVISVRGD